MEVRTFIKREGADTYFFEVTWEGLFVELAEGPVGTDGQISTKKFRTTEEVVDFIRAEIEAHLAEGFAEHTGGDPETAAQDVRNPEMEAAIAADLDDVQAYLVYGDWLESQGDPRGELIALQHRMIDSGATDELRRAEQQLIAMHRDYLVGDLGLFSDCVTLEWLLGFIRYANITVSASRRQEGLQAAPFVNDLLQLESARFLQTLVVGWAPYDSDTRLSSFDAVVEVIAKHGPLPHVHTLVLGDGEHYSLRNTNALWPALPGLKRLELLFENAHLSEDEPLPVSELVLGFATVSEATLQALISKERPGIETLDLGIHNTALHAVKDLAGSEHLPDLRELTLYGSRDPAALLNALAKGPLLSRLRTLDLPHTLVRGDLLEEHADELKHLERLGLDMGLELPSGIEERIPGLAQSHIRRRTREDEYDDYDEDVYGDEDDYYDEFGE